MGIKGLTDLIKICVDAYGADFIKTDFDITKVVVLNGEVGPTYILDASMFFFRYGSPGKDLTLQDRNVRCVETFIRFIKTIKKTNLVVVFDQVDKDVDVFDELCSEIERCGLGRTTTTTTEGCLDAAGVLQSKTATKLERRSGRIDPDAFVVTHELVNLVEAVCQHYGVKTCRPLVEADWTIAYLARQGGEQTYVITDDTDLLLHDLGDAKVLRSRSLIGKKCGGFSYEMFTPKIFWSKVGYELGTSLLHRATLATILGTDYFHGITGIGPKTILRLFNLSPITGLRGPPKEFALDRLVASLPTNEGVIKLGNVPIGRLDALASDFSRQFLHPSLFEGMKMRDAIEVAKTRPSSLKIPVESIHLFVSTRLSKEAYDSFKVAVSTFLHGPDLEGKNALSRCVVCEKGLSMLDLINGACGEQPSLVTLLCPTNLDVMFDDVDEEPRVIEGVVIDDAPIADDGRSDCIE